LNPVALGITGQAGGIGGLEALDFAGALRRQQQGRVLGIEGVEFFLKAVFGDDPVDAALADRELRLAKLLGDDRRGGLGVQKELSLIKDGPNRPDRIIRAVE
jgi:hypothetical protein